MYTINTHTYTHIYTRTRMHWCIRTSDTHFCWQALLIQKVDKTQAECATKDRVQPKIECNQRSSATKDRVQPKIVCNQRSCATKDRVQP